MLSYLSVQFTLTTRLNQLYQNKLKLIGQSDNIILILSRLFVPFGCRLGCIIFISNGCVTECCTTVTFKPVHLLALFTELLLQSVQYTSFSKRVIANECERSSCPFNTR